MKSNTYWLIGGLCIGALGAFGCSDDDDDGGNTKTLTMSFTGLESLGDDYQYEGWLIVDGAAVTSGRFDIDSDGNPTPATFEIDAETADNATKFVLTIEPRTNDPAEPSDVHVVAGPISSGSATLSIGDSAALGTDFANAAGAYILATPSSAADDDDNLGIWWLDPSAGPGPTLSLPTLPTGWIYEGWIVGSNGPVSTGRFAGASGVDSDDPADSFGTDGCTQDSSCPPFPGQDFINPALDLIGLTAVISVEPVPDDSPNPFAIKPLIDATIENVAKPATQDMANMSADNPTGSITLE